MTGKPKTSGRERSVNTDLLVFLENFRPDGFTTFVGIVPDGPTVAATFNVVDPSRPPAGSKARTVLAVSTSPRIAAPGDLRRKPTKNDIVAIASLWADVDPRDSNRHRWTEERDRLCLWPTSSLR